MEAFYLKDTARCLILDRVAGLIFLLVSCPVLGQGLQKKVLTQQDYGLWSTLRIDKVSASGKWASYTQDYEEGGDTLFVCGTDGKPACFFAGGRQSYFGAGNSFVCMVPEKMLVLADLKTGRKMTFTDVLDYVPANGKLIISRKGNNGASGLEIRDWKGALLEQLEDVTMYKVSPDGNKIVYAMASANTMEVFLMDIGTRKKTAVANSLAGTFVNPVWNAAGDAAAFLQKDAAGKITAAYLFDAGKQQCFALNPQELQGFPKGMEIAAGFNPLQISDDSKRLFLNLSPIKKKAPDPLAVQIWNGNDVWIHPRQQKSGNWAAYDKLGVWWPEKQLFRQITTIALPEVMLDGKQRFAVTYNPMGAKALTFNYDGQADFYLTDLETGNTSLLLQQHSANQQHMIASPGGKYLAYLKDGSWRVYDLQLKKHFGLANSLPVNVSDDGVGEFSRFTIAGWDLDDRAVFVSDRNDLWKIEMPGGKAARITNGLEQGRVYRISNDNRPSNSPNYNGLKGMAVDGTAGFFLTARDVDYDGCGYYRWDRKRGLQLLDYQKGFCDQYRNANDGQAFVYRYQRYDVPPAVFVQVLKKKPGLLFQGNQQHYRYLWGRQELITYRNSKGEPLQGLLYYPADYEAGKKYPMVVSIYEKLSGMRHQYSNPGEDKGNGFNVSHFTAKGYLVLRPDIIYETGDPGISALDCVSAAVAAVIGMGVADQSKVGLIGHSFGGYETDFIITQTNLFAAAVSGAGVSELTSAYLAPGWNTGRPDMWRFEHQQMRMGQSLFENPEGYRRNSPMTMAANVTTPLLSWIGGEDREVATTQSIGFYLALRRLGKQQVMLLYPGESHALVGKTNQQDLNRRVEDWFNHFLKGMPAAGWISEGVSQNIQNDNAAD